jgi:serine/threonine protein phosphatase PrpC
LLCTSFNMLARGTKLHGLVANSQHLRLLRRAMLSDDASSFDIIAQIAEKNRLFRQNERRVAAQTAHATRHGSDGALAFGASAMQGLRATMEDASVHVLELPGAPSPYALFGVFDGHGGAAAADFVASRIGGALVDAGLGQNEGGEGSEGGDGGDGGGDAGALERAIAALDAELVAAGERSGCCALLALLRKGGKEGNKGSQGGGAGGAGGSASAALTVASVGDSRAVLGRRGGAALVLSAPSEHKPGDAAERARIERAGGEVRNVPYRAGGGESSGGVDRIVQAGRGGLAVARALGDASYKRVAGLSPAEQLVVSTPHVVRHALLGGGGGEGGEGESREDEFLLLACDGVWDVMGSEEAAAFVRHELRLANKQCLRALAENFGATRVEVLRSKDVGKYEVGAYWDFPRTRYKATRGFVMRTVADDGSGKGPGEVHLRGTPPAAWEGGWCSGGGGSGGGGGADNRVTKSSLARAWPCSIVCERLVDECLERGSDDNLSAVLVLFDGADVGMAGHDGSTMDDLVLGRR